MALYYLLQTQRMSKMLNEFLEGRLTVLVDKRNKREISEFYSIIKCYIEDYKPALTTTIEEYLMVSYSGPYHFIKPKIKTVTGGAKQCIGMPEVIVTAKEFIEECNKQTISITEEDFYEVFA